jgi:beta-glucosidase
MDDDQRAAGVHQVWVWGWEDRPRVEVDAGRAGRDVPQCVAGARAIGADDSRRGEEEADGRVGAGVQDAAAARAGTLGVLTPDLWNNTWYADPAFFGRYPEDGLRVFGAEAQPPIRAGDMETIKQPLDFYGVNIYDGRKVRAGGAGGAGGGKPEVVPFDDGHPQTAFKWFITPPALYWGPRFIHERYKVPIYITENGLSGTDWVMLDGKVHDPQRIDYTTRYLRELERAMGDGVDVRGYFHWSLLDNFEWAEGYKERFGLVHVDFPTGKRTPKESAAWYRGVIERNGV